MRPVLDRYAVSRMSALVVDDQRFARQLLCDLLRVLGFMSVRTACDGREAVEQIQTWAPNVVLTDWRMSPMDGFELIDWIRRDRASPIPEAPILLVTGHHRKERVAQARDSGVNEIIVKPFSPLMIEAKLAAALSPERAFVRGSVYVGPCRRRRDNDSFRGRRRRLSDPPAVENRSDEQMAAVEDVAKDARALNSMSFRLDARDRAAIREMHARSHAAWMRSHDAADGELEQSLASLVRYIEGVGASGRLDAEVVQTHIGAIMQIVNLPLDHEDLRADLVENLERMVRKKLRWGRRLAA